MFLTLLTLSTPRTLLANSKEKRIIMHR